MMKHSNKPIVILGAGLAGLSAANYLRRKGVPVILFEAGNKIAGLAQSFHDEDGFTYDFGAHFITNRLAKAVGIEDKCRTVKHYAETVWLGGKSYSHPFGLMKVPRMTLSGIGAKFKSLTGNNKTETAADWFRAAYGEALADEVAIPLTEAWSGAKAEDLSPAVGDGISNGIGRTLLLKIASRLTRRAVSCGYSRELPEKPNVYHVYPMGGIGTLCQKLAEGLEGVIKLDSPVEKILVENGRAIGVRVNGKIQEASAVISTAPVNILGKIVEGTNKLEHLTRFRYRPMIFVNLRLEGRGLLPDVVTWTPESEFPFFRLTETTLSMPWLAPEGKTVITVDIGCEKGDEFWQMDDEALGELCIENLKAIIPDVRSRYLGCKVMKTPIAYPVFLSEYEEERRALMNGTGVENLYSIGRNGEFSHIFMEDVHHRTEKIMDEMLSASQEKAQTSASPVLSREQQILKIIKGSKIEPGGSYIPQNEAGLFKNQRSRDSNPNKKQNKEVTMIWQGILIWLMLIVVASKTWLILTAVVYLIQHSEISSGYRFFGAAGFATVAVFTAFYIYNKRLWKSFLNKNMQAGSNSAMS